MPIFLSNADKLKKKNKKTKEYKIKKKKIKKYENKKIWKQKFKRIVMLKNSNVKP